MSWNLHRWTWRLEAPLYIGMPPAGMLNRCRLYVPARAVHGAVTAELARIGKNENGGFPDYGKMGQETGLNCRFTYLYPAEKVGENYYAWLPRFEKEKGLVWRRQDRWEDDKSVFTDRKFRNQLLDSRPGTAIDPDTSTAEDNTLRETECINPWWRQNACHEKESSPVYLLGYIFLKENGFSKQLESIETLFIGGDTRYGLGRIRRIKYDPAQDIFEQSVELNEEQPVIKSNYALGHVPVYDQEVNQNLHGQKERTGGWDIDKLWEEDHLSWVPGSCLEKEARWKIDTYGFWVTNADLVRKSKRQVQRELYGRSSYKMAEQAHI